MSPRWIIQGGEQREIHNCADHHARCHPDAHEAADAHHGAVDADAQAERADIDAHDLGNPGLGLRRPGIVVIVDAFVEMPRVGPAKPFVEAQQLELHEPLPAVADEELHRRGDRRGDGQHLRLDHALPTAGLVKRVEHDAAGAALRERHLVFVDEPALQREGEQHAQQRHHAVPGHHLPPGNDPVRDQHVGRHDADQGHDHVAGRRGDRLRTVVLEDRDIARRARAVQHLEQGEREDHGSQADANRDAGLRPDVKRRRREDAAEEKSGQPRAPRELRHVAAINVLKPPFVLLGARPGPDLVFVELLNCHEVRG
jgi:hypothetical protein